MAKGDSLMSSIAPIGLGLGCGLALVLAAPAMGQALVAPYNVPYSLVHLGSPPGVPNQLGGICFKPGNPNRILIGGSANNSNAVVYEIGVTRASNGFITGWDGEATPSSAAPGIDGGLCEIPGSGGTLAYATYSGNVLGQILSGASTPARTDDLGLSGVAASTGTCQFVPPGLPGAGTFIVASYSAS